MNFLKAVFILLFIIVTVITVKIHPEIHQPMLIEDQDFVLVRISDNLSNTNVPVKVTTNEKAVQNANFEQVENTKNIINYNTEPQQKIVKAEQSPLINQKINIKSESQKSSGDDSQIELLQKILSDIEKQEQRPEPKKVTQPETITKPEPKKIEVKTSSNPYMTEQEEIIAWNKWRSDIHNQIMMDSDIGYAFYGTVFSFSFVVDKFGNVSNIKVEANPPEYMDIARNGVKPAISRLQKKPILNFPRGTKRTTVVVEGKFAVGVANVYSTPSAYSDYEKVRY